MGGNSPEIFEFRDRAHQRNLRVMRRREARQSDRPVGAGTRASGLTFWNVATKSRQEAALVAQDLAEWSESRGREVELFFGETRARAPETAAPKP
jgi:hypothetical protein